MTKILLTLFAACLLSSCIIYIDPDHNSSLQHEVRTLNLDATQLIRLNANTEAGDLEIIGEPGRNEIELVADIYYLEKDKISLRLEADGSDAKLVARFIDTSNRNSHPHIDIVIKVSARFALKLDDGSGSIKVDGLTGDVAITDGSGHLNVKGAANIDIDDGSGHIDIQKVTGTAIIKDGSGHLNVSNVGGDVRINDGSGHIDVSDVEGIVTITDGSGNISIKNTGGLNLLNSSSGSLKISGINGPVTTQD